MQTDWLSAGEIERLAAINAALADLRRERALMANRANFRKWFAKSKAQQGERERE